MPRTPKPKKPAKPTVPPAADPWFKATAAKHKAADTKAGKDWLTKAGCRCPSCSAARAALNAPPEEKLAKGKKAKPTADYLKMELPLPCDAADDAKTPEDVVWAVLTELDLIEEGQDSVEGVYSKKEITVIRKFVERWRHLIAS